MATVTCCGVDSVPLVDDRRDVDDDRFVDFIERVWPRAVTVSRGPGDRLLPDGWWWVMVTVIGDRVSRCALTA